MGKGKTGKVKRRACARCGGDGAVKDVKGRLINCPRCDGAGKEPIKADR